MEAKTLKNTLEASVLYICIIALLYRSFLHLHYSTSQQKSATSKKVWIPMVELNHGGSISSSSDTMSGATHTTATTLVDNVSISRFSEIDRFGYPTHDPRIDGSQRHLWYHPKMEYKETGVFGPPSIGSSGELDRVSLGRSRSTPANQPQWDQHTGSTEAIYVPRSDDPRYY